jgi:transposase-like protein
VGWRSSDKFNAVLETAALSESETAQYCRRHGLYPEQIARWRTACAQANDRADRVATGERVALKSEKARRKRVERELRRKDAALAETAALLALRKKAQAIWGEDEDV